MSYLSLGLLMSHETPSKICDNNNHKEAKGRGELEWAREIKRETQKLGQQSFHFYSIREEACTLQY